MRRESPWGAPTCPPPSSNARRAPNESWRVPTPRRSDAPRRSRCAMSEVDPSLLVDVLKRAGARGATAADGFLIEEQSFNATVRLGQVDTVTHSREQRLALRGFSGRASAAASTSDLSR